MHMKQSWLERGDEILNHGVVGALAVLGVLVWTQGCAPRPIYRPSLPPPAASSPRPAPPAPPPPQARSIIEPGTIREEDLKDKRIAPQPRAREQSARSLPPPNAPSAPAPPPEESSLLAKITPTTTPQRAASLRLTEEGRRLLESGDHARALSRLEKTIAIDSTNPYGYYFLAKAHTYLGRPQESLNFLDVAESLFAGDAHWLSEVLALRGEDYRALGFLDRAEANFSQALRLNPGNRLALDGLSRVQGESRPAPR